MTGPKGIYVELGGRYYPLCGPAEKNDRLYEWDEKEHRFKRISSQL